MSLASNAAILQRQEGISSNLESIQVFTELQIELQNTIEIASDLKSENANLKRQLDDAAAFSKANLQRHADWKDAWKKEREGVSNREKELEREESKWRVKLEERKMELDQLERKHDLKSNGVESGLRHDIMLKEIQAEHDSKTERLEQETRKWREQFFESRKGYEGLQAQNSKLQSQVEWENSMTEAYQNQISLLQQNFAEHIEESSRSNQSSASSEASLRDLKLQLEEKGLQLERLHQEVKDIQKARDDAVCSKDEITVSHQAETGRAIRECAENEAIVKTLERRIQAAEMETKLATEKAVELGDLLKCANKETIRLQEMLTAKEESYERESGQCRIQMVQAESAFKRENEATNAALAEEQAKTKELERRCLETQEHALKQIANLAKDLKRDDNSEKLLIAQGEILRLENTYSNLQNELKQLTQNHQAEASRLQHACESCHKDLNLVLLEKNNTEKNAAADRMKATQGRKELEESEHSLLKLDEKYQLLLEDKMKLSQKIKDLKSENNCLESKVKCTLGELGLLQGKALSDRENSQEVLRSEVHKLSQQLSKEKRRSEAYKGKAIEAHERSTKAKQVLDSLCSSPK